jgi:endonuclease III
MGSGTHGRDARAVARELSKRYGDFAHYNRKNPLEELLFIICSIQTDERSYRATFRALQRRFPRVSKLASATEQAIAETIEKGGLSRQKASAIRKLLSAVIVRFGRPTLAPLRRLPDDECEAILASFPGVGKKVARCVMMYSLNRKVFPVDTHCWRICQRIGWVRKTHANGMCSPRDMDRAQARIPPEIRFSLHVNMVALGREICMTSRPKCSLCPLCRWCRKVGVQRPRV